MTRPPQETFSLSLPLSVDGTIINWGFIPEVGSVICILLPDLWQEIGASCQIAFITSRFRESRHVCYDVSCVRMWQQWYMFENFFRANLTQNSEHSVMCFSRSTEVYWSSTYRSNFEVAVCDIHVVLLPFPEPIPF